MLDGTQYFFLSDDLDITRFIVWHLFYITVLTGTWVPIWRQSEIVQPRAEGKRLTNNVIVYGYQTRKRRERKLKMWARWVLMNPDYVYNSVVWFLIMAAASAGSYYAQTNVPEGDTRSVALWLAGVQTVFFGTWTIAPFYLDMPGWGVLHLGASGLVSVGVLVLYATLDWVAFGAYGIYTVAQLVLALIYGIAFVQHYRQKGMRLSIGNPVKVLLSGGLHPISYLYKDIHLPNPGPETKRMK